MQLSWMVDVNVRPPNTFNKSEMFFYPKTQEMGFVENTKSIFVGFFYTFVLKITVCPHFSLLGNGE